VIFFVDRVPPNPEAVKEAGYHFFTDEADSHSISRHTLLDNFENSFLHFVIIVLEFSNQNWDHKLCIVTSVVCIHQRDDEPNSF